MNLFNLPISTIFEMISKNLIQAIVKLKTRVGLLFKNNELSTIVLTASFVIVIAVIVVVLQPPSRHDILKWAENNKIEKIQKAIDAELKLIPSARASRVNDDVNIDIIKESMAAAIKHNIISVRVKLENLMISRFDSYSSSDQYATEICNTINSNGSVFINISDCLNIYINSKSYPESLIRILARHREAELFDVFAVGYKKLSNTVGHGGLYKIEASKEQLEMCCKYAKISNDCSLRVADGLKILRTTIEDCDNYHKNQIKLSNLYAEISDDESILSSNIEELASKKLQQSKIFRLYAYMIGQAGVCRYEIDVNGRRAFLITFNREFSSRGMFSLPVTKLMDAPVTLKEEFGGFSTTWPVVIEADPESIAKEIVSIEEKIQSNRKQIAKTKNIIDRIITEQKKLEFGFEKEINDSKWPFGLSENDTNAYYTKNHTNMSLPDSGHDDGASEAKSEYLVSDMRLNAVYNEIRGKLGDSERQELKRLQRDWLKTRNAECGASPDDFKNSTPSDDLYRRWANSQNARIDELKRLYLISVKMK